MTEGEEGGEKGGATEVMMSICQAAVTEEVQKELRSCKV